MTDGRESPQDGEEALRAALSAYLTPEIMERLKAVCDRSHLTVSELLSQAIDAAYSIEFDGELSRCLTVFPNGNDDPVEAKAPLMPVAAPVPPNLVEAFGYEGDSRYVAFHWEPVGDELMFDDGRSGGTGKWYAFERWREHPAVAGHLQDVNLGYSDLEATHWLIVDRQRESVYVAHVSSAQSFLQEQRPPLRVIPKDKLHELETFVAVALRHAVKDGRIDPDQIERAARARQRAIEQMLAYLDNLPHDSTLPPDGV